MQTRPLREDGAPDELPSRLGEMPPHRTHAPEDRSAWLHGFLRWVAGRPDATLFVIDDGERLYRRLGLRS